MPISVVMPAYNAAPYIGEAIQSVLNQTDPEWELVIVDDNSKDNTKAIVAQYSDPRIRYIHSSEQLGAAGARNRGTEAAQYDLISYFDADDRLMPEAFATLKAALEHKPEIGVVYANYVRINEKGERFGSRQFTKNMKRPSGDVLVNFLQQNRIVNGGLALVRKTFVQAVGGWNPALKSSNDWALWVLIATQTRFLYIPHFIALEYRELPTGITQSINNNFERAKMAIDAVYSHKLITEKIPQYQLKRLRNLTESHKYALLSCQHLKKKCYKSSFVNLFYALKLAPKHSINTLGKYTLSIVDLFI